MNSRALRLGLVTILGLARRGFFIPYRYADRLPEAGSVPPYDTVRDAFKAREPAFREVLALLDSFGRDLGNIGTEPPPAPRWEQDWFPRLDAAVLYAFIRHHRPRRVVEVGSGHSTRFIARAVADEGLVCAVTAIDPQPRALLSDLEIRVVRATVQEAGLEVFEALEPGDVLIVDSSHVLMPGSDVDVILNRVLPKMPKGLLVHFHDIFLPGDYPREWAWRGYNEQTAVAQLILGGYRVEFASHHVATAMSEAVNSSTAASLPLPHGAYESSLWLQKVL